MPPRRKPEPAGLWATVSVKLKPVYSYWLKSPVKADKAKPHSLHVRLLPGTKVRVMLPKIYLWFLEIGLLPFPLKFAIATSLLASNMAFSASVSQIPGL